MLHIGWIGQEKETNLYIIYSYADSFNYSFQVDDVFILAYNEKKNPLFFIKIKSLFLKTLPGLLFVSWIKCNFSTFNNLRYFIAMS